jgi:hypothetical protein
MKCQGGHGNGRQQQHAQRECRSRNAPDNSATGEYHPSTLVQRALSRTDEHVLLEIVVSLGSATREATGRADDEGFEGNRQVSRSAVKN